MPKEKPKNNEETRDKIVNTLTEVVNKKNKHTKSRKEILTDLIALRTRSRRREQEAMLTQSAANPEKKSPDNDSSPANFQ